MQTVSSRSDWLGIALVQGEKNLSSRIFPKLVNFSIYCL